MGDILIALTPIFLLIVLGYGLKNLHIAPESFWAPAEWMTFYVFFPALLFRNISRADVGGTEIISLGAASLIGVLTIALIVRLIRDRLPTDGPAYTSVFQGAMRPNVYLGIIVALALFGETGLALASVCIAVLVPTVNILGVIVLVRHAGKHGTSPTWRQTLVPVARNPLILACAAGGLVNASGMSIPLTLDPLLEILGRASLPLALLAVGAGLDIAATRRDAPMVALTSVFKVIALPAITWGACLMLGVEGLPQAIAVMYAALPGSGTAYVLARQMGGDAVLLAGSITATTIASGVILPVILLVLAP